MVSAPSVGPLVAALSGPSAVYGVAGDGILGAGVANSTLVEAPPEATSAAAAAGVSGGAAAGAWAVAAAAVVSAASAAVCSGTWRGLNISLSYREPSPDMGLGGM